MIIATKPDNEDKRLQVLSDLFFYYIKGWLFMFYLTLNNLSALYVLELNYFYSFNFGLHFKTLA